MKTVIEVLFWVAVVVAGGVLLLWLAACSQTRPRPSRHTLDRRAMRADADRLAGGR